MTAFIKTSRLSVYLLRDIITSNLSSVTPAEHSLHFRSSTGVTGRVCRHVSVFRLCEYNRYIGKNRRSLNCRVECIKIIFISERSYHE